MDIDVEQIRELMRSIDEHGFDELELETDGSRLVLRRHTNNAAATPAAIPQAFAPAPAQPPVPSNGQQAQPQAASPAGESAEEAADPPDITYITSPFVGTFYGAPGPGEPPYVDTGQEIEVGQTLCIIEAMKLMNEIEADVSGTIVDILGEDGKPVEYGDRLFKVRKRS